MMVHGQYFAPRFASDGLRQYFAAAFALHQRPVPRRERSRREARRVIARGIARLSRALQQACGREVVPEATSDRNLVIAFSESSIASSMFTSISCAPFSTCWRATRGLPGSRREDEARKGA